MRPGDLATKLYLTANCGLWCSLLGQSDSARQAAGYLLAHLDQGGKLPGFLHTQWLAASLWFHLGIAPSAEHALDYLLSRLNDLAVSNLSWLIISLRSSGVPRNHPLVKGASLLLEMGQLENGSWPADMPAQQVHATLEALHALKFFDRRGRKGDECIVKPDGY